jgi:hypothetical protein
MSRPRLAVVTDTALVLICAGCGRTWEPVEGRMADRAWVLAGGCPACGDWFYLTELAHCEPEGELP